jgi:hypothetical protein
MALYRNLHAPRWDQLMKALYLVPCNWVDVVYGLPHLFMSAASITQIEGVRNCGFEW